AVMAAGSGLWLVQRRAETAGAVHEAPQRTADFQAEARWPEALATAQPAAALLQLGGGSAGLRNRVQEVLKDLEMVARLEEIRIKITDVKAENFDLAQADRLFAQAFRDYGIDVEALEPAEAADRIRARSIAGQLAAALDEWVH